MGTNMDEFVEKLVDLIHPKHLPVGAYLCYGLQSQSPDDAHCIVEVEVGPDAIKCFRSSSPDATCIATTNDCAQPTALLHCGSAPYSTGYAWLAALAIWAHKPKIAHRGTMAQGPRDYQPQSHTRLTSLLYTAVHRGVQGWVMAQRLCTRACTSGLIEGVGRRCPWRGHPAST